MKALCESATIIKVIRGGGGVTRCFELNAGQLAIISNNSISTPRDDRERERRDAVDAH